MDKIFREKAAFYTNKLKVRVEAFMLAFVKQLDQFHWEEQAKVYSICVQKFSITLPDALLEHFHQQVKTVFQIKPLLGISYSVYLVI